METSWLPNPTQKDTNFSNLTFPVSIIPVTHMFVSHQLDVSEDPKFKLDSYFVGDALLDAERFAVGFLSYIRAIDIDEYFVSFACGSPTLDTFTLRSIRPTLSPIPTQTFITRNDKTAQSDHGGVKVKLQPKVRDIELGSWALLVSLERFGNPEAVQYKTKYPRSECPTQAVALRYAFIRAQRRVPANFERDSEISAGLLDELVGPASVKVVGGLQEFLRETAPHVDSSVVERLLNEMEEDLGKNKPADLAPGMKHLAVLDDENSRAVFREFFEDL